MFKNLIYIPSDKTNVGYFLYFFIFVGYLELSPSLGNVV